MREFLVSVAGGLTVALCTAVGRGILDHKEAARQWLRAVFERWMLPIVFFFGTVAFFSLIALGISLAPSFSNDPPRPIDIHLARGTVCLDESITVWIDANDPDDDPLTIVWKTHYGSVEPVGPTAMLHATYIAPNYVPATSDQITATVSDNRGGEASIGRAIPIVVCSGSP